MIDEDDELSPRDDMTSLEMATARKTLEMEMRQTMQKEFDERLEVRTQEIEVDCRVELQREKERFEGTVREMEAKLVAQRVQNETEMEVLESECREKLEQFVRKKGQTKRAMMYA